MSRRPRSTDGRTRRWRRILAWVIVVIVIVIAIWRPELLEETSPGPDRAGTTVRDGSSGGVVGVFIEPDDGRQPILDELQAARRSIDLQVYLLSDNEIIDALIAADERGVRVRVMMEEHPFGGAGNQPEIFDRLAENGVEVRWAPDPYRFAHIKAFVIDDAVAIIMNLNLTYSSFTRNREFAAITTRPDDVAVADQIFEADWIGAADPPDGSLVVSPSSSRIELLAMIDGAQQSLDIYAEVVRDTEIIDALTGAVDRGVRVRIIIPEERDEDTRRDYFDLVDQGLELRTLSGLYEHAKLIIADDEAAFVGSQNFTTTSLDRNRELGIILTDDPSVNRLDAVFESDYANGRDFS